MEGANAYYQFAAATAGEPAPVQAAVSGSRSYGSICPPAKESAPAAHPPAASAAAGNTEVIGAAPGFLPGRDTISCKVRMNDVYTSFSVYPATATYSSLMGEIMELYQIEDEVVSLSAAYLLWFVFGWLGIHRWYVKKHNSLTWLIWTLTGQFLVFGWLYDGLTLWHTVRELNQRQRNPRGLRGGEARPGEGVDNIFGFVGFPGLEDDPPKVWVAYLLWLVFGFLGIHRLYTGHATAAAWVAWLLTLQMFLCGWLWDGIHTYGMATRARPCMGSPIVLKAYDGRGDYVPIMTTAHLVEAMQVAISQCDRELRVVCVRTRDDLVAYAIWLILGLFGAHILYLRPASGLPTLATRALTLNFLALGWIAEGVVLPEMVDASNECLIREVLPSSNTLWRWPGSYPMGIGGMLDQVQLRKMM